MGEQSLKDHGQQSEAMVTDEQLDRILRTLVKRYPYYLYFESTEQAGTNFLEMSGLEPRERKIRLVRKLLASNARLHTFKQVLNTPPARCNPHAAVEVHSVTCHRHLLLYVLAIKSLLRFTQDLVIVAHDDGTLSPEDKKVLREHIRSIRIVHKDEADRKMEKLLHHYPHCKKYREQFVNAKQIIDVALIGTTRKIVQVDSDTLFLQKPSELMNWIETDRANTIILPDDDLESDEFGNDIYPTLKEYFPLQYNTSCSLLGFDRDIFRLDLVESVLKWMGKFHWVTIELLYSHLIRQAAKQHIPTFLDPKKYQHLHRKHWNKHWNWRSQLGFVHYFMSHGVCEEYEKDALKVISELRRA